MRTLVIACLILFLLVLPGCAQKEEIAEAESPEISPPAEPVDLVQVDEPEEYLEVDPGELAFSIEDFYYDGVVGEDGLEPIGGEVGVFKCEGQALELATAEFVDGFIVTKEYGKIKVRFTTHIGGGSFAVWLTPTQKKALMSLKGDPGL